MKEKLLKLLKAKQEQREALNRSLIECDDKEKRAAIGETLKSLADEIKEVEDLLKDVDAPAEDPAPAPEEEGRSLNVLGTMQMRKATPEKKDKRDSEEYRKAFMEFACRGVAIPKELRGDATTTTTDASEVIPTTILKEMVIQLKEYGDLYSRVRKLNIQGGVKVPILSLKPTATWITADTATKESDKQKLEANTSVTFNYYGLECKVAQTLLVNVVSLEMFEELFTKLAVEAIAQALDIAIINGDGNGEPLGIANDTRVPNTQVITMPAADVGKWDEWKKKVFAKIPKAYRKGSFIMAQGTFDSYIDAMVDGNGQPIARVNYGIENGETYRFGGKEVITVEPDVIKDWDSATGHASTGDVVAIFCNLSDYAINSNQEMQATKWVDHDTNEIKNKVIMICDGKLVDPNGVVIIKKGV